MENTNLSLVMTTKNGSQLFFNEETGKFSSENKKDILDALTQDMENVQSDPKAALCIYLCFS